MNIKELAEKERDTVITLRRHFHENPELSQQEFKTMDFIENFLHQQGIETVRVPRGGVFGFIDSGKPGWTILLRADIDALPIQEDPVNLSKKKVVCSKNEGVMHACGHDGHISMLLTTAKILAAHKDEFEGKVILMFEEAEEIGERGCGHLLRYLRDHHIHVDTCFATHVMWCLPAGKVGLLYGTAMAGAHFFNIKLYGKGGHGSRPDMAVSPIECFISIAEEIRAFRMRMTVPDESFTYSFGTIQAGNQCNIIPDDLFFGGSARFTKNEDGMAFREMLLDVVQHTAKLHGCKVEFIDNQFYPAAVNTKECVDTARKAVMENLGEEVLDKDCPMWMASETYAMTESVIPGILMFTGIYDPEVGSGSPHHTPKFDIAENGLVTGVGAEVSITLTMLKEKPETPSFRKADLDRVLELAE